MDMTLSRQTLDALEVEPVSSGSRRGERLRSEGRGQGC